MTTIQIRTENLRRDGFALRCRIQAAIVRKNIRETDVRIARLQNG